MDKVRVPLPGRARSASRRWLWFRSARPWPDRWSEGVAQGDRGRAGDDRVGLMAPLPRMYPGRRARSAVSGRTRWIYLWE